MKLAHIVPPRIVPYVSDLLGDYHLLLPHLIGERSYRHEYLTRTSHNYQILDNGVAEGAVVDFNHLLMTARAMSVDEVVMPDVMRDMDKTLTAVASVFYQAFEARHHFKFMFVCQGKTSSEIVQCAERAMNLFPGIIGAFGIPRHIVGQGRHATRAGIADNIRYRFPHIPIHLLGMSPEYPKELIDWARGFRDIGVRGVDTSMAWNATKMGIELSADLGYDVIIERQSPEDFKHASFTHPARHPRHELLRKNMEVMNSWVK